MTEIIIKSAKSSVWKRFNIENFLDRLLVFA